MEPVRAGCEWARCQLNGLLADREPWRVVAGTAGLTLTLTWLWGQLQHEEGGPTAAQSRHTAPHCQQTQLRISSIVLRKYCTIIFISLLINMWMTRGKSFCGNSLVISPQAVSPIYIIVA